MVNTATVATGSATMLFIGNLYRWNTAINGIQTTQAFTPAANGFTFTSLSTLLAGNYFWVAWVE
jgi:hypothetical protein